ncbi:MAG: hypothetical protein E7523_06840 [Ruminococcaceae bacterium]|nr:hypothetical protein [Oscillospiraceae bacterium]
MKTSRNEKQSVSAVDHSGHRKRLRKRAAMEGIAHFEPHNLLELLLFYPIPRADTNDTAHRLLDTFGSFSAVLDASCEDLKRVHGVGAETAQFLTMLPEVFRIYLKDKEDSPKKMKHVEEITQVLMPLFVGQKREVLYMVCLQAGNTIGKCIEIAEGSGTEVALQTRRIVSAAILSECVGVVLAHNHPSGQAKASNADYAATAHIANVLNAVDIPLIEHFVFADGRFTALSTDSRFVPFFGSAFRTIAKIPDMDMR